MNYKLQLAGQKVQILLSEEQASAVRAKMTEKESFNETVTLGLSVFKVSQIKSLFPAEEIRQGKAGIRKELSRVAKGCESCEGEGFLDVFVLENVEIKKWEVGCLVEKRLCNCQRVGKEMNGIPAEDFEKLFTEFSFND